MIQLGRKLVRLIEMCLNETYSIVHIDKYLSDNLPIQNRLKQVVLYHLCFSTLLWNRPLGRSRKTRCD
jgi:hypothetical protein